MRQSCVRVCLALILAGTGGALAQTASSDQSAFTQDQVTQGHKDYYTFCGECHGDGLAGNGAKPGAVAFDKSSAVKIGAVADGRIVPAVTGP